MLYLIALGSNMRHPRLGQPRAILDAAIDALAQNGLDVLARSPTITSRPLGPSQRNFANAAAVVETPLDPIELLNLLQSIEREFGRPAPQQRIGQRWRARMLDLDIVLWSGGMWQSPRLTIPHAAMTQRDFVLGPASSIAGEWREPVTGLSLRQLNARL